MKILIVSLTLPPENSATANIIGNLIPQFQSCGHKVDGLSLKANVNDENKKTIGDFTVYYGNYINNYPKKHNSIKAITVSLLKRIEHHLPNYWRKGSYHEWPVKSLVKAMKKFQLNDYDMIICPCAYYDAIEAVLRYKKAKNLQSKVALLQLDPLTDNGAYPQKLYNARKAYEKMLYETCDVVFTTPIIYDKCDENGFKKDKAVVVEFPLIKKHEINEKISTPKREDGEVRCVFAGYLYPTIRDAKFTLELFSKFKNSKIKLYILGNGQESLLEVYEKNQMKGRLIRLGSVSTEICDAWINDADVLINIGNSVLNQVPSKIFDYISRGKTILNICKSQKCPTLKYLENYSLATNVVESAELTGERVSIIEKKTLENAGKRISFSELEKQYVECTPEYVAKQILNTLN